VTYTTTSACSTYQRPIYNTPIPNAPCYVCAFSSQNIPTKSIGFITATTVCRTASPCRLILTTHQTYCPACTGKPNPPTIYACPTCSGITLTETCPWVRTPPFSAAPYTSYEAHTHVESTVTYTNTGATYNAATLTTMPTNTRTPVQPTSTMVSAVQYTAGAAPHKGGLGVAGAVFVAAALAL
jgi:hypothetical protein